MVRRRILEHALQRRIADEQRGVGVVRLRERNLLGVREEHAHEDGGCRALRSDGDRVDAVDGSARDQLDRVDRALGRDAESRQDAQPVRVAAVGDRRDRREVDLARDQLFVEVGRDAADLVDVGVQLEEDGRHVHVGDTAEADHAAAPFHRCTSL